jgi:hypothetical protein
MGGVTATVGVLCLVAALLIATVGRMVWPRVVVALTLTGSAGILNSTVGPYVRTWVNRADAFLGQFIGQWTGTVVTGLLGLVLFTVAGFWVAQKKVDLRTLAVTAAVPPTVTLIPGTLGTVAVALVGFVPWLVAQGVAIAFGIG